MLADSTSCYPALQHDKTGLQQELLHQATDHERERNKLSQQNQELSAKLTALTQESEATRFAYEEQVRCAAADSLRTHSRLHAAGRHPVASALA